MPFTFEFMRVTLINIVLALKSMLLWKLILTFTGIDHLALWGEKARGGGMLCYLGIKAKTIQLKIKRKVFFKKAYRFVWEEGKKSCSHRDYWLGNTFAKKIIK